MTDPADGSPQEPDTNAVDAAHGPVFEAHDPVFPSLEAGGGVGTPDRDTEDLGAPWVRELPYGIVALGRGRSYGLEFDDPETDRLQRLVEVFVRGHVRRLKKGFHIRGERLENLILPDQARLPGMHGSTRYWIAQDVSTANFSALEAMSGGVVIPNLVRRALTKAAYAWLSLLTILAAVGAYQLAVALNAGGQPPVSLERVLLYVVAALVAGSLVFTDRFWRLDR